MTELFQYLTMLVSLGLLIIGLIVAFYVAMWLIEFLINGAQSLTEFLINESIKFLGWLLQELGKGLFALPTMIWAGLGKATALPVKATLAYAHKWKALWAEHYKMWELWLEYGVDNFDSFSQFKRAMNGEEEPRNEDEEKMDNEPKPPKDRYNEALALFGFNEGEVFNIEDLKKRYRALISAVHPDRCHSNILATLVNEARDLIKKRRKWK